MRDVDIDQQVLAPAEQAGGRVTDIRGKVLEFTHGPLLQPSRGIIATRGVNHDEVVEAVAATR